MAAATRPSDPKAALPLSFAIVAKPKEAASFFAPIQLAPRQDGVKDGCPGVAFSPAEVLPGKDRLQHSLVAKFLGGRPKIDEVRKSFQEAWVLEGSATVGVWDAQHILITLKSEADTKRVLTHPLRKVGQYPFKLFWWAEDFHPCRESTIITAWVKLPTLPPNLYDQGYIASIVGSFGRFLAIDDRTKYFSNPSFARACVELDVAKTILSKVWVGFGGDRGYW